MSKSLLEIRKYQRDWRRSARKTRPGFYEKEKTAAREYRDKIRDEVFKLLGERCAWCGFADRRALQIDHINGGGNKERKELRGHNKMLIKILAVKGEGYQILCANCNNIKKHEQKEHPYAHTS